jgi:hypothetical protein
MNSNIDFQVIDWTGIPKRNIRAKPWMATRQTLQFPGVRVRIVNMRRATWLIIGAKKAILFIVWKASFESELQTWSTPT